MNNPLEKLKKLDNDKLIDVVKNYRQYGYDETIRTSAISLLSERGISKEDLELTGNFENQTYDLANNYYKSFNKNSKIALALYFIFFVTKLIMPRLTNTSGTIQLIGLLFNIAVLLLYLAFLIMSFMNQSSFYKAIGKEEDANSAIVYIFGGILYVFMYFLFRNQMKEKMKLIN